MSDKYKVLMIYSMHNSLLIPESNDNVVVVDVDKDADKRRDKYLSTSLTAQTRVSSPSNISTPRCKRDENNEWNIANNHLILIAFLFIVIVAFFSFSSFTSMIAFDIVTLFSVGVELTITTGMNLTTFNECSRVARKESLVHVGECITVIEFILSLA